MGLQVTRAWNSILEWFVDLMKFKLRNSLCQFQSQLSLTCWSSLFLCILIHLTLSVIDKNPERKGWLEQNGKYSPENMKKKWLVCIWPPTKPECATRSCYSGDCTRIKIHAWQVEENSWPCQHSSYGVPQMLSNQHNPTKQVKHGRSAPWDKVFKGQL